MSEPIAPRSTSRRGPFQFSLRTVLVVVTGLCILLSLAAWQRTLGTGLGILIVGSLWTGAALWSGWRRLAYHLASVAMGVIAYVVVFSPITPAGSALFDDFFSFGASSHSKDAEWIAMWLMCLMCVATPATAALLRPGIRTPGKRWLVGISFVSVYVAAASWGLCFFVFAFCRSPFFSLGELLAAVLLVISIGALFFGTLSLHVAWPTAIFFCVILRRIDPLERAPDEAGPDVQKQAAQGATPSARPIDAARFGSPPESAAPE